MSPRNLHIIQHVEHEGPCIIRDWARDKPVYLTFTETWEAAVFPPSETYDGLIVLGGGMNVGEDQRYPWLREEARCIEAAVKAGKPVLGICLGGQLLAKTLGGTIRHMPRAEIGVWPVFATEAAQQMGFVDDLSEFACPHWHRYQFELPKGSRRLFRSAACKNQGFIQGDRLIGLQCHPEADALWVRRLYASEGQRLQSSASIQNALEADSRLTQLDAAHAVLFRILNYLFIDRTDDTTADGANTTRMR